MTGFLAALGTKAAERWLALLALPGALFLGFATASWIMRRAGAWLFDVTPVADVAGQLARTDRPAGPLFLLTVAVLVGAAGVGLAAHGLGGLVQRFWFATRLGPLGRMLTAHRLSKWLNADLAHEKAVISWYQDPHDTTADPNRALAARNRICLVRPDRPMWMADRIRAAGERVHHTYGLDLGSLWPRLWLSVPDPVRAELIAARTRLADDARLCAWGLLYLVPALWWWPSLLIAAVTCTVSWRRARVSCDALSDFVESGVDLYAGDLAQRLGVATPDGLTREAGRELTARIRKDS